MSLQSMTNLGLCSNFKFLDNQIYSLVFDAKMKIKLLHIALLEKFTFFYKMINFTLRSIVVFIKSYMRKLWRNRKRLSFILDCNTNYSYHQQSIRFEKKFYQEWQSNIVQLVYLYFKNKQKVICTYSSIPTNRFTFWSNNIGSILSFLDKSTFLYFPLLLSNTIHFENKYISSYTIEANNASLFLILFNW